MDALSCIDQCFIADETLEQLPAPSQVGKTKVGGIDFNKARMRRVAEAVIALSPRPVDSRLRSWPAMFGCSATNANGVWCSPRSI